MAVLVIPGFRSRDSQDVKKAAAAGQALPSGTYASAEATAKPSRSTGLQPFSLTGTGLAKAALIATVARRDHADGRAIGWIVD